MFTRREFIKYLTENALKIGILPQILNLGTLIRKVSADEIRKKFIREAVFYEKIEGRRIKCTICPRECKIGNLERGYCGVKENRNGKYYTLVYGNPCAVHIDPIEKKPFFHYLPGKNAFSISTAGCNLNCKYCQNWEISQARPEQTDNIDMSPSMVVNNAIDSHCPVIAYTYAEPIVFYEYMIDIAKIARRKNIKSVMVSAGFINPNPLKELCKYLDAIKIDLKGFTEDFYKEICNGELKPVLKSLELIKKSGVWLEIVYLVIPTFNDDDKSVKKMSIWIKENLGRNIPLHFSRFYPMYKLKNLPPTPVETIERLRKIAISSGLNYVYIGNIFGNPGESTYCHKCRKTIIKRHGYFILENNLQNGKCKFCKQKIPGVWSY